MYIYVRHLYTVVYKDMGKVKNVSETTKRNSGRNRAFFELGEEFFHVLRLPCTGRDRNRSSENAQLDHRVCEIKTKPQAKTSKNRSNGLLHVVCKSRPPSCASKIVWTFQGITCNSIKIQNLSMEKNKMQPTNPNFHTYVNGTDVETHGYAVTQNTFLQIVYLNSLVHTSPVSSLQCGVESVECGVWSEK